MSAVNANASSQQPVMWNESTILQNGINFLRRKKDVFNMYKDLWDVSIGTDFYSSSSKLACEKLKKSAEDSRKEIVSLNKAVAELLDNEIAKNQSSEQAKNLLGIAIASQAALNYFESVVNDKRYPTLLNEFPEKARKMSNKIVSRSWAYVAGAVFATSLINLYPINGILLRTMGISSLIWGASNLVDSMNHELRLVPSKKRTEKMKTIFEETLGKNAVA